MLTDANGDPLVWEACVTMNHNWGYCATDHYFKPASLLIRKLVECVSKGGNMILNVGPDGEGRIPAESVAILEEMGAWMEKNGRSIHGCSASALPKPEYGRITQNENTLYFHLFENTLGPVPLMGVLPGSVEKIRLLATGKEIPISTSWVHSDYPHIVFADLGLDPVLPDSIDTVLSVELK